MSNEDKITSLLNTILTRLDDIEAKIGSAPSASATKANLKEADVSAASPAVTSYEEHMNTALEHFLTTLTSLNGEKMGECIREACVAVGGIITAASKSKKPAEGEETEVDREDASQVDTATTAIVTEGMKLHHRRQINK